MAEENTPTQIQVLLETTTGYLDILFAMHHDWPYHDIEFFVDIFYPIEYIDNDFILSIPNLEDWDFEVIVPFDDQLAYRFFYVVPFDEDYSIGFIAGLEYHDDWDFQVTIDAVLDINFTLYYDYVTEERFFVTIVEDLEFEDIGFIAGLEWHDDWPFEVLVPGYLETNFLFSMDTYWESIDFRIEIVPFPITTKYLDTGTLMQGLSEGDVSVSFRMSLIPQFRIVSRISFKEHSQYGSINFSLIYQQDINEPFQLFTINAATINGLPVPYGDPLLTNPVVGNIARTGEVIDLFVDPVMCTSVKMIISETEDSDNIVRIVEFGIFEDIIDIFTDVAHIQLDPKRYHLKSLEQFDDIWFDILVLNTKVDIPSDSVSVYTEFAYVKFVPTHTPPEEFFIDMLRLHIMQTFYFADISFIFADKAPYSDIDFLAYSPKHLDISFFILDWAYLDTEFYFEGGVSFEGYDFRMKQLADTPLDIYFLHYSDDFEEIDILIPALFEAGEEPEFLMVSNIDDIFIDINIAMAEYLHSNFEVMVPSYEEISFFMRHWNYIDVNFHLESQMGDWKDYLFSVVVPSDAWKDIEFTLYTSDYLHVDFVIYDVIPYIDIEFKIYDDQPYLDTSFTFINSKEATQELYGSFNIPQGVKQSLLGAFNILNIPVSGELYGSFNIARTYGKAIITIPILGPDDQQRLKDMGITI